MYYTELNKVPIQQLLELKLENFSHLILLSIRIIQNHLKEQKCFAFLKDLNINVFDVWEILLRNFVFS